MPYNYIIPHKLITLMNLNTYTQKKIRYIQVQQLYFYNSKINLNQTKTQIQIQILKAKSKSCSAANPKPNPTIKPKSKPNSCTKIKQILDYNKHQKNIKLPILM